MVSQQTFCSSVTGQTCEVVKLCDAIRLGNSRMTAVEARIRMLQPDVVIALLSTRFCNVWVKKHLQRSERGCLIQPTGSDDSVGSVML